ncbi:MAG: DUF4465 domain-containing protein [Flavobacteriales bacterium]|jgi:hypothetical protein|nr:DUF4465 domain-containing protein [Flavobacteriales bacterium]
MTNKKLLGALVLLLTTNAFAQSPIAVDDFGTFKNYGFWNTNLQSFETDPSQSLTTAINLTKNDTAFDLSTVEIIEVASFGNTVLDTNAGNAILKYTADLNATPWTSSDQLRYRISNASGSFDTAIVTIDWHAIHAYDVSFDDITLDTNGYYNGADKKGGFFSGISSPFYDGAYFYNNYTVSSWGDYWGGFAVSEKTDTVDATFVNQYSVITGAAYNGNNFGVIYGNGTRVDIPANEGLNSLQITNSTYTAKTIKNGNAFSSAFGGDDGNKKDWFAISIVGHEIDGTPIDTQKVFLADYRFDDNSQDYILSEWKPVQFTGKLSTERVHHLTFFFESTDTNSFGILTPAYACIDQIATNYHFIDVEEYEKHQVSIYPNPTTGISTIETTIAGNKLITVFDITGKSLKSFQTEDENISIDLSYFPNGAYYVRILGKDTVMKTKIIKQ